MFWVVDNGSAHRGEKARKRLSNQWPNLALLYLPVHASRLNQVEIYFLVVQRKVLTPNDFTSVTEVEERLLSFQERYQEIARPFEWKFTRADLMRLLQKLGPEPETEKILACA